MDCLAVLTAYIQDRSDRGVQEMRALSVAADLGNVFVSKRDTHPSVSRGYDHVQILLFKTGFLKNLGQHGSGTFARLGAGADHCVSNYLFIFIHDDSVR